MKKQSQVIDSEKLKDLQMINRSIAGSLDEASVLNSSLKLEREIVDAETGSILLLDETGDYLQFAVALGDHSETLKDHRVKVGEGVAGYVAEHCKPVLIEDAQQSDLHDDYFDSTTGYETESLMCVPIETDDQLIGVAEVINKTDGSAFDKGDLFLFMAFAGQIAVAIKNARLHDEIVEEERLEQEAKTARDVQESYIPDEFPDVDEIEFGGDLTPAYHVSGDFYDCFETSDQRIAYVLGDVSGKGLHSAMYMCRVLTELRTRLEQPMNVNQVIEQVNRQLVETSTKGMFVTLILFLIEPNIGEVSVVNAGHLPYYHRTRHDLSVVTKGSSPPLGIQQNYQYSSHTFSLTDQSVIIAFTDGVTEARNPEGELYGFENVERLIETNHLPPRSMTRRVLHEINRYSGDSNLNDDVTVISFGTKTDEPFQFEINSSPENLQLVRRTIDDFMDRTEVDSATVYQLKVGIVEGISNIIEHTYHNRTSGRIRITLEIEDGVFECCLRDWGPTLETGDVEGRDLDQVEPGGIGVHLMSDMFDLCQFDEDRDRGNCLQLRKEI